MRNRPRNLFFSLQNFAVTLRVETHTARVVISTASYPTALLSNSSALCKPCTAASPCCRRKCSALEAPQRVIHPFRFPLGNGYFKKKPCRPAAGLGVDHALLPVTHIGGPKKGPTDSGGLWFYYAPGCSDFLWDVGRTLLARNRVHLAVELERQRGGDDDRAAVGRVADWVRRVYPRWGALSRARRGLGLGPNASVEELLADAARGLFSSPCAPPHFDERGALRPCECGGPPGNRRLGALSLLAGEKHLLLHAEPVAVQLNRYDSFQLQQQPLGGGSHDWTSELWDVRDSAAFLKERLLSRHLENATRFARLYEQRARRLVPPATPGGAPSLARCVPSARFHFCFSCSGSQLEIACDKASVEDVTPIA